MNSKKVELECYKNFSFVL